MIVSEICNRAAGKWGRSWTYLGKVEFHRPDLPRRNGPTGPSAADSMGKVPVLKFDLPHSLPGPSPEGLYPVSAAGCICHGEDSVPLSAPLRPLPPPSSSSLRDNLSPAGPSLCPGVDTPLRGKVHPRCSDRAQVFAFFPENIYLCNTDLQEVLR